GRTVRAWSDPSSRTHMNADDITGRLLDVVGELLRSDEALPVPVQRVFFAALAGTGKFQEPVTTCLQVMAEVAGDYDEVLVQELRAHRERRRDAQRAAGEGKPPQAAFR